MKEAPWETFINSGMLWFTNRLLHVFGWCLVVVVAESGAVLRAYPARTSTIGYSEEEDIAKRRVFLEHAGLTVAARVTETEALDATDRAAVSKVEALTVED